MFFHRHTSLFYTLLRLSAVLGSFFLYPLIGQDASAQVCTPCLGYSPTVTWPNYVIYADKNGFSIRDPSNDQNPSSIDLVPGTTPDTMSCGITFDGINAFARLQLRASAKNLSGGGNLAWDQYMWQVYVADGNGVPRCVMGFDGKDNPEVVYVCDPTGGNFIPVYNYATQPDCVREVNLPGGSVYLDFQVPICYLEYVSCQYAGYANRITSTAPVRLYFATSASVATINKDYSYGTSLDFSLMHNTSFFALQYGTLPIELRDLHAASTGEGVRLKWYTETEKNSYGFDIERALDDEEWTHVGFVPGQGYSNVRRRYSFFDPITNDMHANEVAHYRLKMLDRDGSMEISPTVSAFIREKSMGQLRANYPDPFDSSTMFTFSLSYPQQVRILVFDLFGREVADVARIGMYERGTHTVQFERNGLPAGRYVYSLITDSGIESKFMTAK